jgi:hypothetical protein
MKSGVNFERSIIVAAFVVIFVATHASAQDGAISAAQANNPLANMRAFHLHNYFTGELTESEVIENFISLRF